MTDKEAMASALEFLEDNQHHIADHERHAYVMLYNDFITALKERLAQETALQTLHDENERLGLYKDAYSLQEPVAFASHGVVNWIADKQFMHEAELYTHPPQRTWVGLTFAEICECENDYLHLFARAIEAKLKEKNT